MAFAIPAPFTYGNCGYNNVRGPGFKSTNLSLFRSFPFGTTNRIEFRLETFNLFNNVNFGNPNGVYGTANFGRITTAGAMRQVQLGARFLF